MIEYKIQLTEVQHRALEHIAADPLEWIQQTAMTRANSAIEQMVKEETEMAFKEGRILQFSSVEDLVLNSKLKTGKQRNIEFEAQVQEMLKAREAASNSPGSPI